MEFLECSHIDFGEFYLLQHIEMRIVRDDELRITSNCTINKLVVILILRDKIEVIIVIDLHKVLAAL